VENRSIESIKAEVDLLTLQGSHPAKEKRYET
jgi:hypothetical protein